MYVDFQMGRKRKASKASKASNSKAKEEVKDNCPEYKGKYQKGPSRH